jgi:Ricin-type beta-trefoil lectin domain
MGESNGSNSDPLSAEGLMDGLRRATVIVGVVFAGAMTFAGGAAADGPVEIRSRLGDACLDAPSDNWPSHVVVNPCNGANFQRWNVTGDQRLESAAFPGKCLDNPEVLAALRLTSCWNSRHWSMQPDGQITAPLGGCVTVLGGPDPGTSVGSRTCTGAPEQGWDSVP